MLIEPLAQASPRFGGGEGGCIAFMPPEPLHQRLRCGQQGIHRRLAARFDQIIRVFAFGQGDKSQRSIRRKSRQRAANGAHGGLLSRVVAVKAEDGRVGQPPEHANLLFGECSSQRGDGVFNAGLGQRDDIHIAFHHDHAARFA